MSDTIPTPNFVPTEEVFGRWKYAEERAKRLIDKGHLIRVTMRPDVVHVDEDDDEEAYVSDDFVVEDLGPRPKRRRS